MRLRNGDCKNETIAAKGLPQRLLLFHLTTFDADEVAGRLSLFKRTLPLLPPSPLPPPSPFPSSPNPLRGEASEGEASAELVGAMGGEGDTTTSSSAAPSPRVNDGEAVVEDSPPVDEVVSEGPPGDDVGGGGSIGIEDVVAAPPIDSPKAAEESDAVEELTYEIANTNPFGSDDVDDGADDWFGGFSQPQPVAQSAPAQSGGGPMGITQRLQTVNFSHPDNQATDAQFFDNFDKQSATYVMRCDALPFP